MGRKHKHEEHENLERWLVSYADFITLLFATFVVLYALGQLDLAKLKKLSASVQAAFSGGKKGITNQTDGVMQGQKDASVLEKSGNSVLDKIQTGDPKGKGGPMKSAEKMADEANKAIEKINAEHKGKGNTAETVPKAEVIAEERGLVIRFASNLFFGPGSASLKPEAYKALDAVAKQLKASGRNIQVEGHTDSQPIASSQFPSNWELSTDRAGAVVRYLTQKHQFPMGKIAAVGYAAGRPVASNATEAGRQKNRRVDIVLLASDIPQPGKLDPSVEKAKPVAKPSSHAKKQFAPPPEPNKNVEKHAQSAPHANATTTQHKPATPVVAKPVVTIPAKPAAEHHSTPATTPAKPVPTATHKPAAISTTPAKPVTKPVTKPVAKPVTTTSSSKPVTFTIKHPHLDTNTAKKPAATKPAAKPVEHEPTKTAPKTIRISM